MSRKCELTGKAVQVGHRVSHSNIKTKHRFLPNLQNISFASETLGQSVSLRVSTHALRSVDHNGGIDAFLVKSRPELLSARAKKLRAAIVKKQAAA